MTSVGVAMSRNLLTVEPTTEDAAVAAPMVALDDGSVLHLSAGVLTERDVLRAVAQGGVEGTNVAAWMTRDPETVDTDESTRQAASIMIHGGFRHLPVLDDNKPVG